MSENKGPKVDIPDDLAAEIAATPGETSQPELVIDLSSPDAEGASVAPPEATAGSDTAAARDELAELKDKYLRLAAEFDNYRRRTLKERQDLLNYGSEALIKELLVTVDNLERALGHAQKTEEGVEKENLLEGVELTHRSLLQTLGKFGVERVEALGQPFDPKLHEAVRQVAAESPPNTVVEVFQTGYVLRDRLLRPAMVVVSTGGNED
jgi:molecular chaperone GrpE